MRSLSSTVRAAGIAVAVTVVLGLLVSWFAWPAKELEPRDLPVVVAGPAQAAAALTGQLESARPGAFQVTAVPDVTAADRALRDHEAYAAFLVAPDGVSLHTASAASPTVAVLLGQAAQQLGGGRAVSVVDVVPGPADDPRGAGFAAGFLPLVIAGLAAGVLLAVAVAGRTARLAGLVAFAVLAGLAGAGVLHALGVLTGGYLAATGVLALLGFAVSAAVAGLAAVLGRAGMALGAALVFLFGNPISAVAAAPELLPQPWGQVGQWLPPGAGATLLRSAVFFDGAGSAAPLWALVGWAGVGVVLLLVGRASITGHRAAVPDAVAVPASASA